MVGKLRRYFSVILLFLFISCFTLIILAHFFVTPERVRNTMVPLVENYLKCQVNLSGIEVSIFSGVTLNGLELLSRKDGSLLLAADSVVLRYQLWPLLQQKVVVDEIKLEHPRVNVEYFSNGRLNLYQLHSGGTESSDNATLQSETSANIDLIVTKIYISDGEVLFRDYSFGKIPHLYKLTDLGLSVANFSLTDTFALKVWGKLNGVPLDIVGELNPADRFYDLTVIADGLDTVQFQPYYRAQLPAQLANLSISVDTHIVGHGNNITAQGEIDLHQLDVTFLSAKKYPLTADKINIDYNFTLTGKKLRIETLNIDYDGVKTAVDGSIMLNQNPPLFDLNVQLLRWSLRSVVAVLPTALARAVSEYSLAGDVDVELSLCGSDYGAKNFVDSGVINVSALQATIGDLRPAVDGKITIDGKKIQAQNLSLIVGDNRFAINIASDNWYANRPLFNTSIRADNFNSQQLSSRKTTSFDTFNNVSAGSGRKSRQTIEPQPIKLPVDIIGDLVINTAQIDSFKIDDLHANYSLKMNKLSYDTVVGKLANGVFNASGNVDLSLQGFSYGGHVTTHGIDLSILVKQLDPQYVDTASGTLSFMVDYHGAGTQRIRLQQNLSLNGELEIVNGTLTGTALVNNVADVLQLPELRVFSFTEGSGKFSKATGGLFKYNAQIAGHRAVIKPLGSISINGLLDADLMVLLSPEVVADIDGKAKIAPYLQNNDGWGMVPLTIAGTIKSPRVSIDLGQVSANALQKAGNDALLKINKKHGGSAVDADIDAGVQLLNSTLQGILGN